MSAVAAVMRLRPDGTPAPSAEPMVASMARRAPDGTRTWSGGPASLGHAALHVTPHALGEQLPLAAAEGNLAITADARIDNRSELLRELRLPDAVGDGRLILAAYERWGESCPERLLGDFAFAIWDARHRSLFCATDRFAVRPLHWYRSGEVAAVATEIKALLALDAVPRRLNATRLADVLTFQFEDVRATAYEDIERLPAAHALTLDANGARLRRYWSLRPERAWTGATDAEYEEAFRETFFEAVRCRMRAPEPVAALLSGGIDSSSIVSVARRLRCDAVPPAPPLHTFSALYPTTPRADEREYIDAVIALGDLVPHFFEPEAMGALDDWEGAAWRGDEPELHSAVPFARAAYPPIAAAGARCVLDGLGGDLAIPLGAERLTDLTRRGHWLTLAHEVRELGSADYADPRSLLHQFVIGPFVPVPLRRLRAGVRDRRAGHPAWARSVPLDPEFTRQARLGERYTALNRGRERPPFNPRRAHLLYFTAGLLPLALAGLDRLSAGFGLEARYPFLDSRVVELCMAMPTDQKLRDGYGRDVVRRALVDVLPPKVRWRKGKGRPGASAAHTLPTTGRETMDAVILGDPGPIARYVDVEAVRALYRQCLAGAGPREWMIVYRVTAAALWLEHAQARFGLQV